MLLPVTHLIPRLGDADPSITANLVELRMLILTKSVRWVTLTEVPSTINVTYYLHIDGNLGELLVDPSSMLH